MISSPLLLGLTGWPLGHSLSPRLHAAALRALGLRGAYDLYPVPPLPEGQAALAALLGRIKTGLLHGINVTIPHKQSVLSLLDELSPAARSIGAANTLLLRRGHLLGENTDAPGFLADLQRQLPQAYQNLPAGALVLGAGGAARAVVYALAQTGAPVTVTSRRLEQAAVLAADLGSLPGVITAAPPGPDIFQSSWALIVNTTPLGMIPQTNTSPWPTGLLFPPGASVYDLVYKPDPTCLIQSARAAGLAACCGLGMLVEQAALAFEIWSGLEAPRPAMWAALATREEEL